MNRRATFVLYASLLCVWMVLLYFTKRIHLVGEYWEILPTMLLGSFVAGTTPAGGGAVAFPVLTLVFKLEPIVARDFSVLIQSVGMTAASVSILVMRASVDWTLIRFAMMGSLPGLILGTFFVAPILPPAFTKLFFVSLWLAFGCVLLIVSRSEHRVAQLTSLTGNQKLAILLGGLIGGLITGITGSGLDITIFSVAVLSFSLNEGTTTRSSIIMMAAASLIVVAMKSFAHGMEAESLKYWFVAIPVVLLGAPLGVFLAKQRNSHFILIILSLAIVFQFLGAIFIIPMSPLLSLFSFATFVCGFGFFFWLRGMSRNGAQPLSQ